MKFKINKKKLKKIIKNKKVIILIIILLCIPLVSTFSRYVSSLIADYYLESKHFYFNSDKLSDDYPTYQINNWTGLDKVDFEINLDSKKNELQFSDMDITYDIEYVCEQGIICSLNKNSGTIRAANNVDSFTLSMTPTRVFAEGQSTTINVNVTSTKPYIKTIGARFIITTGKQGVGYEIVDEDNSPYLMLNITNALSYYTINTAFDSYQVGDQISETVYATLTEQQKNNCTSALITLNFDPSVVLLDTTNKIMNDIVNSTSVAIDGSQYLNGISFKVESSSSNAIRFYKKDKRKDYTYPIINDTSIIEFNVG